MAAVPHQLFSTTPVLVGFTRGLLGLKPDVPSSSLNFEPRWPRDWTSAEINNIPFGEHKLSFNHVHDKNKIGLQWKKSDDFVVKLNLVYAIFGDEKINKVEVNNKTVPFKTQKMNQIRLVQTTIKLTGLNTSISLTGNFQVKEMQPKQPLFLGAEGK